MGEGKRIQKKEITSKTTVKAIITGYVSYGILIGFIVYMLGLCVTFFVKQFTVIHIRLLSAIIAVIGAFLIYFTMHGVCKLSIYDAFKKCKTNPNNIEKIHTRLNLFILLCVVVSIVWIITMMILNFNADRKEIEISSYKYKEVYSEQFATSLTNKMIGEFQNERINTIISTVILELGMTISYFSVIPYQKKMIERYNKF